MKTQTIKGIERDVQAFVNAGKVTITIPELKQYAGKKIRFDMTEITVIDGVN